MPKENSCPKIHHPASRARAFSLTHLFLGLERLLWHKKGMRRRIVAVLAITLAIYAPVLARAQEVIASPWLDFNEAKIRLLVEQPTENKVGPINAGLEIQIAPGFKTYWRNAGDSGVPPSFDFAKSVGLEGIHVDFPFPSSFDDGAGGHAWGYKHAVILPISARRKEKGFLLDLKLDFAVCGTMCIPLSGKLQLDPAQAVAVLEPEMKAFRQARLALPTILDDAASPSVSIQRQTPPDPPLWSVRLPYPGGAENFTAFPEAAGFLEVKSAKSDGDGFIRLVIAGQAAPGSNGKFGPVRLTYGRPGLAFERVIDLDGAATSP